MIYLLYTLPLLYINFRLGWLPATIQKLQLEALWLIDNQVIFLMFTELTLILLLVKPQPLMQLHEEEGSKTKLICSLLPQKGPYNLSMGTVYVMKEL